MLTKPHDGIIDLQFKTVTNDQLNFQCIELTDLPQDILETMISYYQTGQGKCSFLCENMGEVNLRIANDTFFVNNGTYEIQLADDVYQTACNWVQTILNDMNAFANFYMYRDETNMQHLQNKCNQLLELL